MLSSKILQITKLDKDPHCNYNIISHLTGKNPSLQCDCFSISFHREVCSLIGCNDGCHYCYWHLFTDESNLRFKDVSSSSLRLCKCGRRTSSSSFDSQIKLPENKNSFDKLTKIFLQVDVITRIIPNKLFDCIKATLRDSF